MCVTNFFAVALTCLLYIVSEAFSNGCPDIVKQNSHFSSVHNSTCYLFMDEEVYWSDARSNCWTFGGEMLSIHDASTMSFIQTTLNSENLNWAQQGVWIGAHYARGVWRWTSGRRMGYSNWASGQPGRFLGIVSMEDCALMRQEDGWKWHDYLCGSMKFHYYYICQFPFNRDFENLYLSSGQNGSEDSNGRVLIGILVVAGFLLLAILGAFFVIRHRYNYDNIGISTRVHYEHNDYSEVNQHSLLPLHDLTHQQHRIEDDQYLTPIMDNTYEEIRMTDQHFSVHGEADNSWCEKSQICMNESPGAVGGLSERGRCDHNLSNNSDPGNRDSPKTQCLSDSSTDVSHGGRHNFGTLYAATDGFPEAQPASDGLTGSSSFVEGSTHNINGKGGDGNNNSNNNNFEA